MTDLEKLRQWLRAYPGWETGAALHTDHIDGLPGSYGLYPVGLEVLSRKEDLMGNVTARCRYTYNLLRCTAGQQDSPQEAEWLMAFQAWVLSQSAAGLAPRFGDVPAEEKLRAEKGKRKEASQAGTGTYTVNLVAEFTKMYEE